ncbi:MAG: threonine synthase [Ignavibacteriales bacterium]|nr:threonine synthase [Ignavibacteriales bacterium]
MKFISTNGNASRATFREAVFSGLAPDGGLYVPEQLPSLPRDVLDTLASETLHSIGERIASLFIDDIPTAELPRIVEKSWTFPIPLIHLNDNLFLLELFHGPTLAFKDVGARFLAHALSYYLEQAHQKITLVVATSGDTGSAVAHGFFEVPHVTVYVLYPSGKISRLQEQQMTTLGRNIRALEVDGTFDDCQRLVKQALSDADVLRAHNLTTANSINIGRLIPQVVYYGWAIAQWQKQLSIEGRASSNPAAPTFVVPSGNFGNLTAALYAQAIGIPMHSVVAATNANDVVPDYLRTGVLTTRASIQTLSNAMDVGNPSNLARVQALFGGSIDAIRQHVSADTISDDETVAEIRRTYDRTGITLDPHTAVGVAAAKKMKSMEPTIVAATAHPGKFPEVIERALGFQIPLPQQLEDALRRPKQSTLLSNRYADFKKLLIGSPEA